jgi:hypothetical protein
LRPANQGQVEAQHEVHAGLLGGDRGAAGKTTEPLRGGEAVPGDRRQSREALKEADDGVVTSEVAGHGRVSCAHPKQQRSATCAQGCI